MTAATASAIHLSPETPGSTHAELSRITDSSSSKASSLLQLNHDQNHIFFNPEGFHNHIAHQLLAMFALGASPEELQRAYDDNSGYQRPLGKVNEANVKAFVEEEDGDSSNGTGAQVKGQVQGKWKECLGKQKHFHDFEEYFQRRIDEKGWQEVVKEALFAGTERSEDLLIRMFGGFYHPIIHLGYGIEFSQPAIVAEALAQACVHDNWMKQFLIPLDPKHYTPATDSHPTPLAKLINDIRSNTKLVNSPHESDGNKIRDGILVRAGDEMIAEAKKWWIPRNNNNRITEQALQRCLAEMINTCVWFAGAAQRPDREVKFDFFYMHCVNLSVFYRALMSSSWIDLEDRGRLLEMKARTDLALYVSRGSPELKGDEIRNYVPRTSNGKLDSWEAIIARVTALANDDGHASKLIRALKGGEEVCVPLEKELGEEEMPIRGDMWLKLANMAIDSVEAVGPKWIRNVGWDSAWEEVPLRKDRESRL